MIQLFVDKNRTEAKEVAESLAKKIRTLGYKTSYLNIGDPCKTNTSLVIAIGGDGTMIHAARAVVHQNAVLAGVNCGRLGFLAEFTEKTLLDNLSNILTQPNAFTKTMLLSIEAPSLTKSRIAINECVIRSSTHRMQRIGTEIANRPGPTIDGDGLIISTPTGSTAYALSAGGPIVDPELGGLVICPLAAHSLAFRPFVINPNSTVKAFSEDNTPLEVIIDGELACSVNPEDTVTITKHHEHLHLARQPERSFWEVLRNRLRWAQLPNYQNESNQP